MVVLLLVRLGNILRDIIVLVEGSTGKFISNGKIPGFLHRGAQNCTANSKTFSKQLAKLCNNRLRIHSVLKRLLQGQTLGSDPGFGR
jgi:hypothetical protein